MFVILLDPPEESHDGELRKAGLWSSETKTEPTPMAVQLEMDFKDGKN